MEKKGRAEEERRGKRKMNIYLGEDYCDFMLDCRHIQKRYSKVNLQVILLSSLGSDSRCEWNIIAYVESCLPSPKQGVPRPHCHDDVLAVESQVRSRDVANLVVEGDAPERQQSACVRRESCSSLVECGVNQSRTQKHIKKRIRIHNHKLSCSCSQETNSQGKERGKGFGARDWNRGA